MSAKLEDLSKLKLLIFIGFHEACYHTESNQDSNKPNLRGYLPIPPPPSIADIQHRWHYVWANGAVGIIGGHLYLNSWKVRSI